MSVRPPPPPPYGPHGPYGPYGYAREHPDGTTVLVLGILQLGRLRAPRPVRLGEGQHRPRRDRPGPLCLHHPLLGCDRADLRDGRHRAARRLRADLLHRPRRRRQREHVIVGRPARSPAGRAVAEAWERRWFNQGVTLAADDAAAHVDSTWDKDIVPVLRDYIRIPNVSVAYDAGWAEAGHTARATEMLRVRCPLRAGGGLEGATVEVLELEGRTPLLLVDVPPAGGGPADDTVLLYGHLDKQPPFTGWREGLGPWEPVIEGDRLYGRGGADDGYSTFAAITAL